MRTLRRVAGLNAVLMGAGLLQTLLVARGLQVTTGSTRWMLLFTGWGLLLLVSLALMIASFSPAGEGIAEAFAAFRKTRSLPRMAVYLLAALSLLVLPFLVLAPLPAPLDLLMETFAWRAVVCWLAILAAACGLALVHKDAGFVWLLGATALGMGVLQRVAAFLPELSTNPFSLGWSEASRYYYASLFLSQRIYGMHVPPSVLHPTRYLMQAAPFLVSGLPLWFHRLWQVLLWLGANGWAAWALARRFSGGKPRPHLMLAAWAFLFLFQGPVWYHLVVMVAFVLWGFDAANLRRTAVVVLLASLWAGVSRINWVPFPAALAALLYFLEVPQRQQRPLSYLIPVFTWGVLGAAAGFGSQYAYAALSGNPLDQFGSSFTSDLLWYRLFPSATFPLGVLPGIVLASLPVVLAAWIVLRRKNHPLSGLAQLCIAVILLVFFAGGLIVSVKIGGGSNLHNLDGYLALIMVLGASLTFSPAFRGVRFPVPLLALAVMVPVGFAISTGGPLLVYDQDGIDMELAELKNLVEQTAADGGEVLFISERQLLTFGMVAGVALVPDYEKVFLMEMAMAGNPDYLDRFREDLAAHQFDLIITDRVRVNLQESTEDFAEENNAWDLYVSAPILCYYEELEFYPESRVAVMAPVEPQDDCEVIQE